MALLCYSTNRDRARKSLDLFFSEIARWRNDSLSFTLSYVSKRAIDLRSVGNALTPGRSIRAGERQLHGLPATTARRVVILARHGLCNHRRQRDPVESIPEAGR
ncbi:MAG: hypothetical protein ACLFP6_01750 [Spirochaetaceae bacterium]